MAWLVPFAVEAQSRTEGEKLRNAVSGAILVFAEKSGLLNASDEACAAQTFEIMEVATAHVKDVSRFSC